MFNAENAHRDETTFFKDDTKVQLHRNIPLSGKYQMPFSCFQGNDLYFVVFMKIGRQWFFLST